MIEIDGIQESEYSSVKDVRSVNENLIKFLEKSENGMTKIIFVDDTYVYTTTSIKTIEARINCKGDGK